MSINREVPYDDVSGLTLLCGLNDGDVIPDYVLEHYWRARRLTSRLGHCGPLSTDSLVAIALQAGLGAPHRRDAELQVESFEDKVKAGKVKPGDRVTALWRKKEHEVTFLKVRADGEVECQFDDHKGTNCIPANDVKLLELVA